MLSDGGSSSFYAVPHRPIWLTPLVPTVLGVCAIALGGAAIAGTGAARAPAPVLPVYKSPTCGCCSKWVEHVQAAGFRVIVHDTTNVSAVKQRYGVPASLTSCHTAVVEGYVIEGHVPADVIKRLLRERPEIAGVAVPGMPQGSPGMESPTPTRYAIYTFDRTGRTGVFAHR